MRIIISWSSTQSSISFSQNRRFLETALTSQTAFSFKSFKFLPSRSVTTNGKEILSSSYSEIKNNIKPSKKITMELQKNDFKKIFCKTLTNKKREPKPGEVNVLEQDASKRMHSKHSVSPLII